MTRSFGDILQTTMTTDAGCNGKSRRRRARQRYKWTDGIAGSKGFPTHIARAVKDHHTHVEIKAWHPDVSSCAFKIFFEHIELLSSFTRAETMGATQNPSQENPLVGERGKG